MTEQKPAQPPASAAERLTGALAVLSWAALLGYYLVLRTLMSPEKERLDILGYYGLFALGSLAMALAVWGWASWLKRRSTETEKPPRAVLHILLSVVLFYAGVRIMLAFGQESGIVWTTLTPLFCGGMALYFSRRHGWRPGFVFYFSLLVSVAHFHAVWIAIEVYTWLEAGKVVLAGRSLDLGLVAAGFCGGAAGAGLSLLGLWWRGGGFRSFAAIVLSMLILGVVGAAGLPLALEVGGGVTWYYGGLLLYVPWQAAFAAILTMLPAEHGTAPAAAQP